MLRPSMGASSLDEILRGLEPRGEVRFELGDVPIDELLLTLHETRFTGILELGRQAQADRVVMRGGKVLDAIPTRYLHVQLLADVLRELELLSGEELRRVLESDAAMDGETFGRRLVARGMLTQEQLREAVHEQAMRRLFYLYDHSGGPALIRQGLPAVAPVSATPVDILPAVAYGVIVRAHPRRRQAMLAFAAHKRVRIAPGYDVRRNRCGLPEPLLGAAGRMSERPVVFGAQPCITGLTGDTTAGLLLLFQRISLLEIADSTPSALGAELTPPPATTTARVTSDPLPRAVGS